MCHLNKKTTLLSFLYIFSFSKRATYKVINRPGMCLKIKDHDFHGPQSIFYSHFQSNWSSFLPKISLTGWMTNLPLSFRLIFSIFIWGKVLWKHHGQNLRHLFEYLQWNRFVIHSVMTTMMIIRQEWDSKKSEGLISPKLWLMIERIWSPTVTFDKNGILTQNQAIIFIEWFRSVSPDTIGLF